MYAFEMNEESTGEESRLMTEWGLDRGARRRVAVILSLKKKTRGYIRSSWNLPRYSRPQAGGQEKPYRVDHGT